jgi:hypothetical protein
MRYQRHRSQDLAVARLGRTMIRVGLAALSVAVSRSWAGLACDPRLGTVVVRRFLAEARV